MYLLLLLSVLCLQYGTNLEMQNETICYSFLLSESSSISILAANDKEYISFRYGYPDSVYLEFRDFLPVDLFTGDYYVRNGGLGNSGIELTTIYYSDNNTMIEVYDGYFAENDNFATGIIVTVDTVTVLDSEGLYFSRRGSLVQFFNDWIDNE